MHWWALGHILSLKMGENFILFYFFLLIKFHRYIYIEKYIYISKFLYWVAWYSQKCKGCWISFKVSYHVYKKSYGWSRVELHDKNEGKKEEKGWITIHKLGGYERLEINKSYHTFKLHTYRLLMSCLVGKKTKKIPIPSSYIYIYIGYLCHIWGLIVGMFNHMLATHILGALVNT